MVSLVVSIMAGVFSFAAYRKGERKTAIEILGFAITMGLIAYAQLT